MTKEKTIPPMKPCPECGGQRVIAECTYQLVKPLTASLKSRRYNLPSIAHTPVSAFVCTSCGFTSFYAQSPKQLIELSVHQETSVSSTP